jgi:hypothetical protein
MEALLGLAPDAPLAHDVKVQGRATTHQIDVLWEAPGAFGGPFTVLFECKKHARRVEQKDLMAFRTVVDDVAAVRGETLGVFVVSSGYQSGAVNIASTCGIVILELREPRPSDLNGRITAIDFTFKIQVPVITDGEVVVTSANADDDTSARFAADHPVVLPDGRVTTLTNIVSDGVIEGYDRVDPVRVTRNFAGNPAILQGTSIQIQSISATVGADSIVQPLRLGGAERFSLVLNATVPGASAFLMEDGKLSGDVDSLRALVNQGKTSGS